MFLTLCAFSVYRVFVKYINTHEHHERKANVYFEGEGIILTPRLHINTLFTPYSPSLSLALILILINPPFCSAELCLATTFIRRAESNIFIYIPPHLATSTQGSFSKSISTIWYPYTLMDYRQVTTKVQSICIPMIYFWSMIPNVIVTYHSIENSILHPMQCMNNLA
jgi:hypothetical protein